MIITGLLLMAIFSALRALLPWYYAHLVLALLSGLTLSVWAVSLAPSIASLTDEARRPFAFSLIFASGIGMGGLGGIVGGVMPGQLQTLMLHPDATDLSPLQAKQITLLFACAIALLPVLLIARLRLGASPQRATLLRRPHPFLIRFLPAVALWSFITGSFAPFAGVYFARHLGAPLQQTGFIFSISQAAHSSPSCSHLSCCAGWV